MLEEQVGLEILLWLFLQNIICHICVITSAYIHFLKNLFIHLFLAVLGLRCCAQAFFSCSKRCYPQVAVSGLLLLQSTASRARASGVVARGFSCPKARGILLNQGSNWCLLYWQADSPQLQGSPAVIVLCRRVLG